MSNAADWSQSQGCAETTQGVMSGVAGAMTVYTAGGTADAQTVTMSPALSAYSNKLELFVKPVADNTGAMTFNVNGLGTRNVKLMDGTDPYPGAVDATGLAHLKDDGTNLILLNPAQVSGSFTATGTGFSGTAPTTTYRYIRDRNGAILNGALISGTSNATTFTITGVPATIRPSAVIEAHVGIMNNTVNSFGQATIQTDGTITVSFENNAAGGWTAAGLKRLYGFSIAYRL